MDIPDLSRPRPQGKPASAEQEELEELHHEMGRLRARVEQVERSFEPVGWLHRGQFHPKGCACPQAMKIHDPANVVFRLRPGSKGFGRIRLARPGR